MEQQHADKLDEMKKKIFDKLMGQEEKKVHNSITSMVHIMISKYTQFLDISDQLIMQIGSLDILLDLI